MENKELIADRLKTFLKIEPKIITPHESLTQKDGEKFFGEIRSVMHPEIGNTYFVKSTVGKLIGHKGFRFSAIIKLFPQLYKNSVLIESIKEKEYDGNRKHKKHSNIEFWHNTLNKFKIKNDETQEFDKYVIRFTVTQGIFREKTI